MRRQYELRGFAAQGATGAARFLRKTIFLSADVARS